MNKKHLWGILVVLAISAFVLYSDLKTTPINELVKAAQNINIVAFVLIFVLMILSYVCEASIIAVLAHRKNEPRRSKWSFLEFQLFKLCLMPLLPCRQGTTSTTCGHDSNGN